MLLAPKTWEWKAREGGDDGEEEDDSTHDFTRKPQHADQSCANAERVRAAFELAYLCRGFWRRYICLCLLFDAVPQSLGLRFRPWGSLCAFARLVKEGSIAKVRIWRLERIMGRGEVRGRQDCVRAECFSLSSMSLQVRQSRKFVIQMPRCLTCEPDKRKVLAILEIRAGSN